MRLTGFMHAYCVPYSRPDIRIGPLRTLRAHHPASSRHLTADADRRVRHRRLARHDRTHADAAVATPARPPTWLIGRTRAADDLPFLPRAFVFDVEGTLVDSVLPTLHCWTETLAEIGVTLSVADLHPYSGMDGKRMLRHVLKKHDPKLLDHIAQLQAERYRIHYLPHIRAFSALRQLFTAIKRTEAKIALATTCDKSDVAHYRALMEVDDLIDVVCCGDDLKREKPAPDIVALAAKKLRLPPAQIAMVGDSPCDAEAARAAGLTPIGLQSGHFSRSDLQDAGCTAVFFDLQVLARKLEELAPPAAEQAADADLKSHTVEAVDSR
jgi:HAD superfamily hydrolase (TIGR01509 family)